MICQLQCLEEAVLELPFAERLWNLFIRNLFALVRPITAKNSSNRTENPLGGDSTTGTGVAGNMKAKNIVPLNLKPGEHVRVKTFEDVQKTLDMNGKYQGLAFTPVMKKFCGGSYRVVRRVERAFDERKWKLSRLRNVVILEGVYCDGAGGIQKEWDGCDRMCFIWWKEAWLERVRG